MLLDNIKVAIRIRPFNNSDLQVSDIETLNVQDQETVCTIPPVEAGVKQKNKTYKFNWVFDRMASQKDIFEKTLEYQVIQVLDGFNFTIFSYGAPDSGKSHTYITFIFSLMKLNEDYGLLIRSLNKLFSTIQAKKRKIQINFSYLEIVHEQLFDLLNSRNSNLEIRDDAEKGMIINGVREIEVSSTQEAINLIQYGRKNKGGKQHEIMTFTFLIQDGQGITNDVKVSKLIVADLGWVERGGQKNQNISMQVLNNCISLLSEAKIKNIQPFIPSRNSKLTRLLKESLGGNSKTLMISCVSPAVLGFEDTIQTLEYSQMAMGIFNQATMKVIQQNVPQEDYKTIYDQLANENAELKKQLNSKQIQKTYNNEKDIIQQFEENILQHFNNEQDVHQQLFKYQWEIEVTRNRINENQDNLERIDGLERKKSDNLRAIIEQDKKQSDMYEEQATKLKKQMNEFDSQRRALDENIKQSNLAETSRMYLNNLIEKHILKLQVLEIKHKESINELHKQEQERTLAIQRSQISLRDRIISDQRKHIQQHAKNSSAQMQHFSQVDTTTEVLEGTKAKLRHYALPKVKDHYFNREAYLQRKESPASKYFSPRLQTPLQLIDKKPYVPKTPHVRLIDNLSTPVMPKSTARVPPQKTIDSKSMVALPSINSNRNLSKFVYDWRGGGYKFVEDKKIPLPSKRELQSKQNLDKSFFSNSSRSVSAKRVSTKQSLLLPGRVHESPYVKGFINKEIQRKMRLQQLNQKMKKVQQKK